MLSVNSGVLGSTGEEYLTGPGLVKGDFLEAMPRNYEPQLKAIGTPPGLGHRSKSKTEHKPTGKLQAVHCGVTVRAYGGWANGGQR